MTSTRKIRTIIVFAAVSVVAFACSGGMAGASSGDTILVGSTPADTEVRTLLGIDTNKPIDFIRWELRLHLNGRAGGSFTINAAYGEAEPNTRGFKQGGQKAAVKGIFTMAKAGAGHVYKLMPDNAMGEVSLLRLGDNAFHVLTTDGRLMPGNGGWGYMLTRKDPAVERSAIRLFSRSRLLARETAAETTYEGRTPCVDLGRSDLPYAAGCLKLKWRIKLRRNASTGQPASYVLESTLNRRQTVEGKWALIDGPPENPDALILQLDPDRPGSTISFLVGDENILLFLDKEMKLRTGNDDFGFALTRRNG